MSSIYDRWKDSTQPAYIIAEAGVNHNGDPKIACRLIDAAAESGADAVKFQTFSADKLVSRKAAKAEYQKRAMQGENTSQYEMLKALELSREEFAELKQYCAQKGVTFMSTPFDEDSADDLDAMDVDAFKISSGDLTTPQLLQYVARKGRPMIISTGMATLLEVTEAVEAIRLAGNPPLAILHCVSNYPAAAEDCNLNAMTTIASALGEPIGWSDHTEGTAVSLAAVALGARIIEKHFTLSRDMPGPDHKASIEPAELKAFVDDIREVESAMGSSIKGPTATESEMRIVARRSLVAQTDIPAGTMIEESMISIKRPGFGVEPKYHELVVGRTSLEDIDAEKPIPWSAIRP